MSGTLATAIVFCGSKDSGGCAALKGNTTHINKRRVAFFMNPNLGTHHTRIGYRVSSS